MTLVTIDAERRDEMWRAYAVELVRYATVLVGPVDAHEITIEAFLRATATSRSIEPARLRAYLFRAVTNEAHNHRRAQRRRRQRDLAAVRPAFVDRPDPLVDVRRAVASLSVRQRAVIYLVYWDDMTESAAADVLDISPGSVRRHLVRARQQLRKALA